MSSLLTRWRKLLLLFLWLIFCFGVADVAMGVFWRDRLVLPKDERNLTYRYDSELGWFPIPNSSKTFIGSRTIHVHHNSRGFRDIEHVIDARPRIIFLGDSFVWGYDVEQNERFTERLREQIPDWAIYNLGVSGYGTDQEYLLLKRHWDFYRPKIVFLIFCRDNDDDDNSRNVRYGGYYKPYFRVDGDRLSLQGIPVPKSEPFFFSRHTLLAKSNWMRLFVRAYFIRNAVPEFVAPTNPTHAIIAHMQRFIKSMGGQLIIGLQRSYPELESFLEGHDIPYVDLGNNYNYPNGNHWTPKGHDFVAQRIKNFLIGGHYLTLKRTF